MTRALLCLLLVPLTACGGSNDLAGLQTFSYAGGDHRSGSLVYAENPPVGGPHNPLWQNCGVYDRPLYNEYAVHSLGHGAVWITYRPGLDPAGVAQLGALVEGRPYTLLSPYASLDTAIAASAWGAQLKVERPDDPRLKTFLDTYGQGPTAPERGAACSGGYGGVR